MGVGRLAPHRVRARYAKALKEIPLPVRSFTGIDPSALRIVADVEIAGSRVEFGVLAGTPRLWVTLPERVPPVLGYLTGFDSAAFNNAACGGGLELHVTETDHLEWARHTGRSDQIKQAAIAAWRAATRDCEG